MRGQTYIISALVFALIVAIFAVINGEAVTVNYLFGTGQVPLILVILISALMGGLITGGFGLFRLVKSQRKIRVLQKENEELKVNATNQLSEDTSNQHFTAYEEQSPSDESTKS
ncbi:lipopolysaccharide assembly LapA domain-containing protein [Paraliobacillus sp. JSM ZJ581]|uniref:LapA family protein n=1 Tax=Paraliobacillus sp. JSM ZJ581 TaxID=3342118 RepID=UPI0035A8C5D7